MIRRYVRSAGSDGEEQNVAVAAGAKTPGLKRTLTLWQLTTTGVGIVIGAGIYVLIGEAAEEAGAALWIAFILAALLSALTGLSYAELAGMYPSAGAEFEFARRAFNDFTGFITGWMMLTANMIAAGAVSIGFAHYLRYFFDVPLRVGAAGLLVVLTALIIAGIQRSIWFSVMLAVLQVGGLVMVIAVGFPAVGDRSLTEGATVSGVLGASALVFFAFIGFDEVVTLSEDTVDPARAVPRALLFSLGISTLLYVLVGIAAVSVIDASELAASDTPLALVMAEDWGARASDIVAVIALASTMNTTLLVLTAASRLTYSMARSHALPPFMAAIAPRAHSPYVAALAGLCVAGGFAMLGDIGLVASVTDFAVYAIFIAVNMSLIVLRFRAPNAKRTIRLPFSIARVPVTPVLGTLTVLLMMAYLDAWAWALGFGAMAAGVVVWLIRSVFSHDEPIV